MREILFKAKTTKKGDDIKEFNNIWVEGDLIESNGKFYIKPKCNIVNVRYEVGACVIMYEVQMDTICRFTGLTDKNGKRIWENDIVKYHFGEDVAQIKFGEYQSCFDNTKTCHVGFYVDWKKDYRKDLGYWVKMIDCNVIGNIFDNPELLEGSNT